MIWHNRSVGSEVRLSSINLNLMAFVPRRSLSVIAAHSPAGQCMVAFFSTSLLSYDLTSSCAKLEPLPGTQFEAGSGGGRIGSLLVVMDR
jgi:hypothetical protein